MGTIKKYEMMQKEINEELVKEKIDRVKSVSQIGTISRGIQDIFINSPKNELTLGAIRVIGHIITCLRNKQIKRGSKEFHQQLSLFDDYWFDINDENTIFSVQMSFLWKDFLPEGNRHYEPIREGVRDLMKYVKELRFERLNEKTGTMKKYRAYVPFINGFVEEEDKGFKISIPNYWYRLIIDLSLGYNQYVRDLFLKISSINAISFYFYLKTLRKIETFSSEDKEILEMFPKSIPYNRGTIKNLKELYKMFKIKKMYFSDFERDYLKPIREELYKKTDISFNYKLVGENLYILTYESSAVLIEKGVYDSDTNKIRVSIKNKAQKYKLTKADVYMLIEIYLIFTYDIVYKATTRKKEINEFAKKQNGTSSEYLSILRTLCEKYVKENNIPYYTDENFGYADNKVNMRQEIRAFFPFSNRDDLGTIYGKEKKDKILSELIEKNPIH